jgi:hypothetical protein
MADDGDLAGELRRLAKGNVGNRAGDAMERAEAIARYLAPADAWERAQEGQDGAR